MAKTEALTDIKTDTGEYHNERKSFTTEKKFPTSNL